MTTDVPINLPADDIDRIIHEPARLRIVTLLYVLKSADYTFVMQQTGMTWGNLSAHLTKLERAGYVEIIKEFVNRKPHSMLRLTSAGRAALQAYRQQMKDLLDELPD